MSPSGGSELLIASRQALLDALEALKPHLDAVIVVGAQAIYMHTGEALVGLAATTKDSDLALDSRVLEDSPLLEEAMASAGFHHDWGPHNLVHGLVQLASQWTSSSPNR
jgi:hypothetical protein